MNTIFIVTKKFRRDLTVGIAVVGTRYERKCIIIVRKIIEIN